MSFEFALVWVVIPVVIAAILVLLLAGRRQPRVQWLTRVESWVASLIGAGAMMTALIGSISLVGLAFFTFGQDPLRVDDMPYSGGPIARLAGVPAVLNSGYSSAWLDVWGVPLGARWLLYFEAALPTLAAIAIGIVVAWLAITLIRGRPFVRALPHGIGVAAVAVMVAGVGAQLAGAFGRSLIVDYLGSQEVTGCDTEGPCEGLAGMALALDLGPIGWALGLALVAAAFQIGARMQHDTEALV